VLWKRLWLLLREIALFEQEGFQRKDENRIIGSKVKAARFLLAGNERKEGYPTVWQWYGF
jgi:hypothetical protein